MAFHKYNTDQYNVPQYNADTRFLLKSVAETVTITDSVLKKALGKACAETCTMADSITKNVLKTLVESQLVQDALAKNVVLAAFVETVVLSLYFGVKRDGTQAWSDTPTNTSTLTPVPKGTATYTDIPPSSSTWTQVPKGKGDWKS